MPFRAGTATADITPYVGIAMPGFLRIKGSEGIHDSLFARALVLDDGETRVAIVACDLLGLTLGSIAVLRVYAEKLCGIPARNIFISCSHTHSGPVIGITRVHGQDPAWVEVLEKKIAGAVAEAHSRLTDAVCGTGIGSVQIGINRRERTADGTVKLGRNPDGPYDTDVGVLRVDTAAGQSLAVVCHHACHPVILGSSNFLISADFPGVAMGHIERSRPGITALFVNGCAGNINSDVVHGTYADAERLGTRLATEALHAFESIAPTDSLRLACVSEQIELPLQKLPPEEEMRALVKSRKAQPAPSHGRPDLNLEWALDVIAERQGGKMKTSWSVEMQAVAIGDTVLVSTPTETFLEIALAIKAASPFQHTLVAGYTNGDIGYLPTARAFEEGGYEPVSSFKHYNGIYTLAPEVEAIAVETGIRLTKRVFDRLL